MTIHSEGRTYEIECNSCGECDKGEANSFTGALGWFKRKGWTVLPIRRMGNIEWKHYCPPCSRM